MYGSASELTYLLGLCHRPAARWHWCKNKTSDGATPKGLKYSG